MASEPKIKVQGLTKIFGPKPQSALALLQRGVAKDEVLAQTGHVVGVDHVSFDVAAGEIYVLMGLSGSGKSTLIRLINRLVEPTAGSVCIDGVDVAALPQPELMKFRRRKLAMVFQSFALMPHRTVLDNVAFGLDIAGTGRAARNEAAHAVLKQVGLDTYSAKYPSQLSGGMQQRVGLARALAVDPDILLMDEAFSALDPLKRVEMQGLMLELQQRQQRTILFVSHDLEEALRIGTRIAIMEGGKLVQEGTPHEIITRPANAYVRTFFQGVDTSRYLTAVDLLDPQLHGRAYIGGVRLPSGTCLPDAMTTVLGMDEPVGVFDAEDRLLGCITPKSLLVRMAQEARVFDLRHFIESGRDLLPLGHWVNDGVKYLLDHSAAAFDAFGAVVEAFAQGIETGLLTVPFWVWIAFATAIGVWRLGWKFGVFTAAALLLMVLTGFWSQTMVTLGLTLSSTVISLLIGVPLGILCARHQHAHAAVRPVLDFMQTMPAFVYLIPAAMLFGLGRVPGIMATVIFAMPPVVRLTSLGIRQVNSEQVEAGQAFGCTSLQLLFKVQLPIALPTIMAGVNQTIMMALSMVIIASMVGAGGLGNDVLASIQRLDIGLGFESGLAVVLLAIILDRLTESFGTSRHARETRLA